MFDNHVLTTRKVIALGRGVIDFESWESPAIIGSKYYGNSIPRRDYVCWYHPPQTVTTQEIVRNANCRITKVYREVVIMAGTIIFHMERIEM